MPKIVNKEKMRESILEAFLKTLLKYGFHNSSMTKIAQEARIAKGTLYLYFDSKESLISAMTEQHFSKVKERLVAKEYFDSLDGLLRHIENVLLVNEEETAFIPIFFEAFGASFSSPEFVDKYRSFFDEVGEFYAQNFQILIDKGVLSSNIESKSMGRVLVSMLDGVLLHKGFFCLEKEAYEGMVKQNIGLLKRGLIC